MFAVFPLCHQQCVPNAHAALLVKMSFESEETSCWNSTMPSKSEISSNNSDETQPSAQELQESVEVVHTNPNNLGDQPIVNPPTGECFRCK